jgi:predicted nucleic acid-binding protein
MIAADTSTWIAYLQGAGGDDVDLLDQALEQRLVGLPSPVLTELLSDPGLESSVASNLLEMPLLEPGPGFWERAGRLRATVLSRQRKARLGDALIAQLCLDHGVQLITRDRDFRAFQVAAGLDLGP